MLACTTVAHSQALRNAIDKKYTMLYKAFAAIDTDNSQYLSFNELKAVCEKFQLPIPVTHVQEVRIPQRFTRSHTGPACHCTCALFSPRGVCALCVDCGDLQVFYQIFDKDGDGRVSYKEFCDKLNEWESQKQS